MDIEGSPNSNVWISGLPVHIQTILIDAGIASAAGVGVKLLLAENMLTLTIGNKPSHCPPEDYEAHKSKDVIKNKSVEPVCVSNNEEQGLRPISDTLPGLMARIDELSKNPSTVTGVSTGLVDLDERTSGMQPGDLIIVAGGPSMGKTTFALNVTEHVALGLELPVLIFSMEMSDTEIAVRILSSVSKVDQERLRTGRLQTHELDHIRLAVIKLHNSPIHIDESTALNVFELCQRARRQWRQYGALGLIVIDYLQLILPVSAAENKSTDLSKISRALKTLAKELNVPIIVISKVGPNAEQRPNRQPLISDLREYGAIEQDADVILFVCRDEVYLPDSAEQGVAEIIIGKQRNGPVGTVKIKCVAPYTSFENFGGRTAL